MLCCDSDGCAANADHGTGSSTDQGAGSATPPDLILIPKYEKKKGEKEQLLVPLLLL